MNLWGVDLGLENLIWLRDYSIIILLIMNIWTLDYGILIHLILLLH